MPHRSWLDGSTTEPIADCQQGLITRGCRIYVLDSPKTLMQLTEASLQHGTMAMLA